MIYNLNKYRHAIKPIVRSWCTSKGEPYIDHVGPLALATSCDIIIIAYFVGELHGFTPELRNMIINLKKFYKPEAIEGLEGDDPCAA